MTSSETPYVTMQRNSPLYAEVRKDRSRGRSMSPTMRGESVTLLEMSWLEGGLMSGSTFHSAKAEYERTAVSEMITSCSLALVREVEFHPCASTGLSHALLFCGY